MYVSMRRQKQYQKNFLFPMKEAKEKLRRNHFVFVFIRNIWRFLTINHNFFNFLIFSSFPARGKKKEKKKYLLPLLLLFKLKLAALLPLAIGFLALLSFKALVVGKIALLLASIIGLKKLFESKKENYEVVAHPHYSHEDHSYARALREAHDLAYNAYKR